MTGVGSVQFSDEYSSCSQIETSFRPARTSLSLTWPVFPGLLSVSGRVSGKIGFLRKVISGSCKES